MLQVRPNVINHPAHPKHDVIPSGVFMPGKDGTPVNTTEELQQLIRLLQREHGRLGGTRAVCSNCFGTIDGPPNADQMFAGCLSPSECQTCGLAIVGLTTFRLVAPHPSLLLAVFGAGGECSLSHATIRTLSSIVVPGNICALMHNGLMFLAKLPLTWLRSPGLLSLMIWIYTNKSMGAMLFQGCECRKCWRFIDRCIEGIPYVPLDDANAQARGLGNMVAWWQRMRNICPKVNSYFGPVYGKEGKQCVTSLDLDEAMLATRDFWFLAPADHNNS